MGVARIWDYCLIHCKLSPAHPHPLCQGEQSLKPTSTLQNCQLSPITLKKVYHQKPHSLPREINSTWEGEHGLQ